MGLTRATVASTLGKLARDDELKKTPLPGGSVGDRRAREHRQEPRASTPQSEVDERAATRWLGSDLGVQRPTWGKQRPRLTGHAPSPRSAPIRLDGPAPCRAKRH
jgi:hypothetical protein